MGIYDEILAELKKEYANSTYQEMAKKYGISYTHMRNLMNGDRALDGISLELLFKLFPRAAICLRGDTIAASIGGNNVRNIGNKVIGHIDNYVAACDEGVDREVRQKIIEEIMASELDDSAKVAVFKIINKK